LGLENLWVNIFRKLRLGESGEDVTEADEDIDDKEDAEDAMILCFLLLFFYIIHPK
jgi:hypothetical protein